MHIIALDAENVKRLRAVHIEPDGNVVIVGGRNAQGKSSIFDGIAATLGGKRLAPEVAVRRGADKGTFALDLGDLHVRRTFTPDGGSRLVVKRANGDKPGSPQDLLDDLVGAIAFDPLVFLRDKARRQQMLQQLVGIDSDAYKSEMQAAAAKRTAANRETKRLETLITAISIPDDLPDEPVSPAALLAQMEEIEAANAAVAEQAAQRDGLRRELYQQQEKVAAMRRALDAATECLAQLERQVQQHDAEPLPPSTDVTVIRDQIADAERINAGIREREKLAELQTQLGTARAQAIAAQADLTRIADNAQAAIKRAHLADGLELNAFGELELHGLPLSQASSAEQLRLAVGLGIAANPDLRIMLIRDGSLLDDDSLRIIHEMADAADYQVWIERVGTAGATVVIEDGAIAASAEEM